MCIVYSLQHIENSMFLCLLPRQVLADAEDAEDRSAAQRATTEQSQDMCDFDEDVVIEGEPAMVMLDIQ